MKKFLLLSILFAAGTAGAVISPRDCATTVASAFPADAVRAEITATAAAQAKKPRKYAAISALRGEEAPHIPTLVAAAPTQVLSLASGGDIYRPLRDFPAANEIHLVDTLTGWGDSPSAVLVELAARLQALPGAVVRVRSRGFTRDLEVKDLCSLSRYLEVIPTHRWRLAPFVWEVEWTSASAGTLQQRVSLHVMNYHDPDDFPALVERIRDRGPIVGALVTGAWEPAPLSQDKLLEAMGPGGSYVFETFAENEWDDPPGPSPTQKGAFERLGYDVHSAGRTHGQLRSFEAFVAVRRFSPPETH